MAPTGKSRGTQRPRTALNCNCGQIHISIGKKLWHPQEKAGAPNARGQH